MQNFVKPNSRVAIQLDNSPLWLKLDKILTNNNAVIIPIPHFFSSKQVKYMVATAGVDTIICYGHTQNFWQELGFSFSTLINNETVILERKIAEYPSIPTKTHKITFTSGTTSEPKGVCLSLEHLEKVGQSLAEVTKKFGVKTHLCLLPLSVLLENVAAFYAAQNANIEVITPSLADVGLSNSSSLDVMTMIQVLQKYQPDSIILMPQMLKAIVQACDSKDVDLSFLKFIAVGGAVCSKSLLGKARFHNLPVYEGYGISECGSVISLNTLEKSDGSVGQVLPHQQVTLADDGEIMTKGELFLGYLGQAANNKDTYATGDIGRFDEDNNLHIIGRKKNIIINSFGRNISPDWIEAELLAIDEILQVVVYGEAKPYLTAICVTQKSPDVVWKKIQFLNKTLPDYAQVKQIIIADCVFELENQMLTASGKTKHQNIFNHFNKQLQDIYADSKTVNK